MVGEIPPWYGRPELGRRLGGDCLQTMEPDQRLELTVFFCQQLDPRQDIHRRDLERIWGGRLRLHPMHCGGRVEALHILKALEEGSDRVLVLTCPEGRCRYREGNLRVRKRLEHARGLLEEIGMEPQRLEFRAAPAQAPRHIAEILEPILSEPFSLGASPLRHLEGAGDSCSGGIKQ